VVVHDIADPYSPRSRGHLIEVAYCSGQLVCLSSAPARPANATSVALMCAQRARAVFRIGSRTADAGRRETLRAEIEAFTASGGRAVCVGQDMLGVDTIMPENKAGASALGQALAAQGHRTFAVLAGPRDVITATDRVEGFAEGLETWSISLDEADITYGAFTRDGGYEAMSTVLARGGRLPDCVFAVNDVMAVGALARLRAGGIEVPGSIAVAGFDDIFTLRDVYPPLTTVRLPLKRMGQMAADLALSDPVPDRPRVVPGSRRGCAPGKHHPRPTQV
jgi:LacI family transcriptional regulator